MLSLAKARYVIDLTPNVTNNNRSIKVTVRLYALFNSYEGQM